MMLLQVIFIEVGVISAEATTGGNINFGAWSLINEYSSEHTPKPTPFLGQTL